MMAEAIEIAVVAVLVIASAAYSLWRLLPVGYRLRLIGRLETLSAGGSGRPAWLEALRRRALRELESACGGCGRPPAGPVRRRGR